MKRRIVSIVIVAALIFTLYSLRPQVSGVFENVSLKNAQVNVSVLNLRTGAGTTHSIIKSLPRGTVLEVLGKIDGWYVVKTSGDMVGCVYASYVAPYTTSDPTPTENQNATAMQAEMLGYINTARADAGLPALVLDSALNNGAYLKSKDMADNGYFDHTSPTYGTPFEMMKSLGISYRSAGENIAKYSSVKAAHDAFMNSPGHRANILGTNYHKVGLGFVQDGYYLYITEWFTD